MRQAPRFAPAAFAALLLAGLAARCSARGLNYDVAYMWSSERSAAAASKKKIANILGPGVAGRLRLVRSGDKYLLIYQRRGSLPSAISVSQKHSRLLTARGLPAAVPVKSEEWTPYEAAPAAAAPKKPANAAARPAEPAEPGGGAAQNFEERLENYLKGLRRQGLVKADERTAWSVYDLADDSALAGVNEEMSMQSASLIKPLIALAYFHEVAAGNREYTDTARRQMEEMIRASDNAAASWFMRLLGGPAAVQRILKANYGAMLRDIELVEYIPVNGHTYRNKASVRDYGGYLHALWDDKLPYSAEMKRIMGLPKRNRLYTGTRGIPDDTEVYDKTGTTSRLCGDMGILVAKRSDGARFPYIVIGLIQKGRAASRYYDWMRNRGNIIRHISDMAYAEIAARHRFGAAGGAPAGGEKPAEASGEIRLCADTDMAAGILAGDLFAEAASTATAAGWRAPLVYGLN